MKRWVDVVKVVVAIAFVVAAQEQAQEQEKQQESPATAATKDTLVVYYSRTGNTASIAKKLIEHFGGADRVDEVEVRTVGDFSGRWGFAKFMLSRSPEIEATKAVESTAYKHVWIGSPVYAHTLAPPMKMWLEAHREELSKSTGADYNSFVTMNSDGEAGAEDKIEQITGKKLANKIAVLALDIQSFDPAVTLRATKQKAEL